MELEEVEEAHFYFQCVMRNEFVVTSHMTAHMFSTKHTSFYVLIASIVSLATWRSHPRLILFC